MAARKLQQEIDRCFKRVQEGIAQFEAVHDKLQQAAALSQKEKLEDSLKREIKKLQRHRDQIKTWTANPDVKDKKPLLEYRKLIETQMEKFKAVEKEMKTKAYSKEGLLNAAKLDPKERQKQDMVNFLSDCTAELDRQIEACEAESENLQATMKKGKKDNTKADRIAELEKMVENHKWHQGKLELIMRLLENGQREVEAVELIKEDIKYYIDSNQDVDFDANNSSDIYEDLALADEEEVDLYGLNNEADRVSSQDTTSIADDVTERPALGKEPGGAARRPSQQMKSPMAPHASLHQPNASTSGTAASGATSGGNGTAMKPAPLPTRPPGELKYASVATAAAAAEKNIMAPLPPPPGAAPHHPPPPVGLQPLPPPTAPKQPTRQPSSSNIVPAVPASGPGSQERSPTPGPPAAPSPKPASAQPQETSVSEPPTAPPVTEPPEQDAAPQPTVQPSTASPEPSEEPVTNGTNGINGSHEAEPPEVAQDDCVYHLPPGLTDLMATFEATKARLLPSPPILHRSLELSFMHAPDTIDSEKPKHYKPVHKYNTPTHYPQEPLPIFDDPALYKRVDTDTLFYVFYYRQGTYQQYLAAKELKRQSWRFHKQYQTWFQRHEEPKTITEEYEQGTYRFFDYESTWMNRRKADFKFVYKYLEDDL